MSVGSSSSQIIPDLDCSLSPEPQFNPRLCQHQSGINNLNCIIVCTMKTHLFIDPLVIRPVSTSVTVDCVDPCTSGHEGKAAQMKPTNTYSIEFINKQRNKGLHLVYLISSLHKPHFCLKFYLVFPWQTF